MACGRGSDANEIITSGRHRPAGLCEREDGRASSRAADSVERPAILRRSSHVAMMQAAEFGDLDDRAARRRLDGPSIRRILVEAQVRPGAVMVCNVAGQNAVEVRSLNTTT
jgi:hypothetical protein